MASLYTFEALGTFSGAFSFENDDGEESNILTFDYFGGKISVNTSAEMVSRYEKKPLGTECRVSGDVQISGGKFRPVLTRCVMVGEKDFEPFSPDELFQGMLFHGPAFLSEKIQYTSRAGVPVRRVRVMLFGATVTLDADPVCFDSLPEGRVDLIGRLFSDVSSRSIGGKRVLSVYNWATVVGARAVESVSRKPR